MNKYLARARELLQIEAQAIEAAAERLSDSFPEALEIIKRTVSKKQKLILMGVGKSHYVAHKLAASFMSTGVTAIFVHPSEALHGDLGSIHEGDAILMFSKSGATSELLALVSFLKNRNPLIAIVGNLESPLAIQCDVSLDASVEKEACPINMLPTASTTVALAIGDALVACIAEEQGFSKQNFASFHPGGSIGKRLNMQVQNVYHSIDKCAHGPDSTPLKDVAQKMSEFPLGAYCIVDPQNKLLGIITEGDLRRALARGDDPQTPAKKIMFTQPITLNPSLLIDDAIVLMEQKNRRVNCAPVLSSNGEFLGIAHIHDLI